MSYNDTYYHSPLINNDNERTDEIFYNMSDLVLQQQDIKKENKEQPNIDIKQFKKNLKDSKYEKILKTILNATENNTVGGKYNFDEIFKLINEEVTELSSKMRKYKSNSPERTKLQEKLNELAIFMNCILIYNNQPDFFILNNTNPIEFYTEYAHTSLLEEKLSKDYRLKNSFTTISNIINEINESGLLLEIEKNKNNKDLKEKFNKYKNNANIIKIVDNKILNIEKKYKYSLKFMINDKYKQDSLYNNKINEINNCLLDCLEEQIDTLIQQEQQKENKKEPNALLHNQTEKEKKLTIFKECTKLYKERIEDFINSEIKMEDLYVKIKNQLEKDAEDLDSINKIIDNLIDSKNKQKQKGRMYISLN